MTTGNNEIASLYLAATRKKLVETYWPQLREVVSSLSAEQLWWRPNEASNSIGNLLMHLNGNVNQWIVTAFDGRDPKRDRPREFSTRDGHTADELLAQLGATIEAADAVLARLTADQLARTFQFLGETVSGVELIFHSVSHFILHYGQIVYAVKTMQNRDLGFYPGLSKSTSSV